MFRVLYFYCYTRILTNNPEGYNSRNFLQRESTVYIHWQWIPSVRFSLFTSILFHSILLREWTRLPIVNQIGEIGSFFFQNFKWKVINWNDLEKEVLNYCTKMKTGERGTTEGYHLSDVVILSDGNGIVSNGSSEWVAVVVQPVLRRWFHDGGENSPFTPE